MFAVVHFEADQSVECVPLTWLEGVRKIILLDLFEKTISYLINILDYINIQISNLNRPLLALCLDPVIENPSCYL